MSDTATVYNFSAGPAMLPQAVMRQAQKEFCNWHDTGLSVLDFSHRGADFTAIAEQAEKDLRDLLAIPEDYSVLFCPGGASLQFSAIAMNFLRGKALYLNSGVWGDKATQEAKNFGDVIAFDLLSKQDGKTAIRSQQDWPDCSDDYDYIHFTPNETIGGVEFADLPKAGQGRWIADMSSCILSQPINVKDYALIYAGAQKNIGPAGLTIVIVRNDWLQREPVAPVPSLLSYAVMAQNQSMYNTPPTYAWYLAGLVFQWIKAEGGVAQMARRAEQRSQALYQFIDNNDFYRNPIAKKNRSRMNIPFILKDESLNSLFLQQAEAAGLRYLKGHRSVGGMRASLYNAMPMQGVEALIDFMSAFAAQNR
ncbi:3-phosphoserine/phosphohydroxythreonine transaminase [Pleionea litopenaei]|uniref:Phosphoserine aminotransferase n=1 Tax=Pleionea litopenaei TaxID=3070815 RepID=A0AA51RT67_9GAMM|nr:3-phosphoserine/phosphohydroxythreonine transaminase [Pleionea sp. HL-JVS1]WMS87231.1 3-phosphoserine/phosphohydroxythreonine transaminase [Pleionea sp. HL-JVS1]